MSVVLLKLAGPLQAWGSDSRYSERKTRHEPTKSGVIGLLVAALGYRREDDISDLARLKVGVRTDQPGVLVKDLQTSHKRTYISSRKCWEIDGAPHALTIRYYLSDAVFVAGIVVPDADVDRYREALVHPAFPLFLGRRSCPPADKILIGVREGDDLEKALSEVPWQATSQTLIKRHQQEESVSLDAHCDVMPGDVIDHYEDVHDEPVSYSQLFRQYEWRRVLHKKLQVTNPHYADIPIEHDPFAALDEVK